MADYRGVEDSNLIGGGAAYSGFGGGASWLWWVLVIILVILFFFRKDDHHGYNGYGYGCNPCNPTVTGCKQVFIDESNYEEEKNINKTIYEQNEKTRAMIDKKFEKQEEREYQKQLIHEAELKTEIALLKGEKYADARFDRLQTQLGRIQCELDCFPKPQPCYIPTVQACAQGCPPLPCGGVPGRCCD